MKQKRSTKYRGTTKTTQAQKRYNRTREGKQYEHNTKRKRDTREQIKMKKQWQEQGKQNGKDIIFSMKQKQIQHEKQDSPKEHKSKH